MPARRPVCGGARDMREPPVRMQADGAFARKSRQPEKLASLRAPPIADRRAAL
jgi:hypothetical protein